MRIRTAEEVYAIWNDRTTSLYCQDYAILYAVLARAVGLTTFIADVQQDEQGKTVRHACAAVCTEAGTILVDPSALWFGAPYKKFRLLSDVEEVAVFIGQNDDLHSGALAYALAPDYYLVKLNYLEKLISSNELLKSEEVLSELARTDIDPQTFEYAGALLDLLKGDTTHAIDVMRQVVTSTGVEASYVSTLASAYAEAGRWDEAKAAFSEAMQCPMTSRESDRTKLLATDTNVLYAFGLFMHGKAMLNNSHWSAAVAAFDRAIHYLPSEAAIYAFRAKAKQASGDVDGASADMKTYERLTR